MGFDQSERAQGPIEILMQSMAAYVPITFEETVIVMIHSQSHQPT